MIFNPEKIHDAILNEVVGDERVKFNSKNNGSQDANDSVDYTSGEQGHFTLLQTVVSK